MTRITAVGLLPVDNLSKPVREGDSTTSDCCVAQIEETYVKTILVLGGYGLTGTHLSRLLLAHTSATIVIAGRSRQKAEALAANLCQSFTLERVRAACMDVDDIDSVRRALASVDLVLLATSFARHCSVVAQAAVETNVDYLDVLYSPEKLDVLNPLAPEIERRGLCFVTEAGFHPGLPLVLVRYIACHFKSLDEAIVSSVIQMKIDPRMAMPESIYDLVAAFRQKPLIFRDGRWFTPWLSWIWPYRQIRFAVPFGTRSCVPFFMPELRHIPNEFPQIRETGFYIACEGYRQPMFFNLRHSLSPSYDKTLCRHIYSIDLPSREIDH